MSQINDRDKYAQSLDDDVVEQIGVSLTPSVLSKDRANLMKENIKRRIKKNVPEIDNLYLTVHSDEGAWVEIAPKIEKKILNVDTKTNTESFLVRIHPGCDVPGHSHDHDELCLMLEGEVMLGDVHLKAGDFHLARKGSEHGTICSDQGALLFIQAAA